MALGVGFSIPPSLVIAFSCWLPVVLDGMFTWVFAWTMCGHGSWPRWADVLVRRRHHQQLLFGFMYMDIFLFGLAVVLSAHSAIADSAVLCWEHESERKVKEVGGHNGACLLCYSLCLVLFVVALVKFHDVFR